MLAQNIAANLLHRSFLFQTEPEGPSRPPSAEASPWGVFPESEAQAQERLTGLLGVFNSAVQQPCPWLPGLLPQLLVQDIHSHRGGTPFWRHLCDSGQSLPVAPVQPQPLQAPARSLTLLHHADFHTAFEPAGLAVAPVVFGDATISVEGTSE